MGNRIGFVKQEL